MVLQLDSLDHFLVQVMSKSEWEVLFYAAASPEDMVALGTEVGIGISADEFRTLLGNEEEEYWVTCESPVNPITHLQKVFGV